MKEPVDENRYTLTEHLSELRTRLGKGLLAAVVCGVASLALSDDIFALMSRPLQDALPPGSKFVVVSPLEYVMTTLEIALTFGLVIASPYVLYQLWAFIAPGLYATEQRLVRVLVLSACSCFLLGAAFCYVVVFPFMVKFLVDMTPPEISGMYSVNIYFGFFLKFMLGFGLAFELPVAIVLLCWLGVLDPAALARGRKYAVVLAFVAAAVLTPTTDPYTQSLMALPLILLYEVGVQVSKLVGKRDKPAAEATALAPAAPSGPAPKST
ncbi:MAG: twin-arginine translocase subunit TatC [Deltaproteobacteria bacterium]|nr:twin-arginine translocase subunit TatC [Deltaproteobacteria bacterium]